MKLTGCTQELSGLRLGTKSDWRLYQRVSGPMVVYPDLRFERNKLVSVEKRLSDAPTFPVEIYVQDKDGRVYLHRAI